jgi:zinc transport system substrate-binding protein
MVCLICGLLAACNRQGRAGPSSAETSAERPRIAVSILPQTWFVEQIAQGLAECVVLAGPGQNPHTYEPSPKQLAELAESKVWVLSGAEFEIGLEPKIRKLFKNLIVVDGTKGVSFRSMDPGDDDEEGGIDRHTWLGREPAEIMAAYIRDALCAIDVGNADAYRQNHDALIAKIEGQFAALRIELAPLRTSTVFVYHPAFGYFLDEFGITQEAVETGGKEPTPRILSALIVKAKQEKPAAIFVQAQFPVQTAKTVADAIGAQVIALDPLAQDWLENIRAMGKLVNIQ